MVLLAIIMPASSGTRGPVTAPDRALLPALSAPLGSAMVFGAAEPTSGPPDPQLLSVEANDAVLLAPEVFQGIDLLVGRGGNDPAYGFIIRPNARPDRIRLSMAGADRLEIDEAGDLLVHHGGRLRRQHRPRAHQDTGGGRVEIFAEYRVGPDGHVRFAVGSYDRSRPLVIHPMLTFPAITNVE